jgi:predicted phosphoribosyltransferase
MGGASRIPIVGTTTFQAVGEWYEDFSQTSDEEVRRLLQSAAAHENSHSVIQ